MSPTRPTTSPTRPTTNRGRGVTVGWFQTILYRYRGIRWMAAAGSATIAFLVLSSNQSTDSPKSQLDFTSTLEQTSLAKRLPATTRGVAVPKASEAFSPGNHVDVHELRTSVAVVENALVVEVTDDDTVIAVPFGQVDSVIDALTTGGVILTLVPLATHNSHEHSDPQ